MVDAPRPLPARVRSAEAAASGAESRRRSPAHPRSADGAHPPAVRRGAAVVCRRLAPEDARSARVSGGAARSTTDAAPGAVWPRRKRPARDPAGVVRSEAAEEPVKVSRSRCPPAPREGAGSPGEERPAAPTRRLLPPCRQRPSPPTRAEGPPSLPCPEASTRRRPAWAATRGSSAHRGSLTSRPPCPLAGAPTTCVLLARPAWPWRLRVVQDPGGRPRPDPSLARRPRTRRPRTRPGRPRWTASLRARDRRSVCRRLP